MCMYIRVHACVAVLVCVWCHCARLRHAPSLSLHCAKSAPRLAGRRLQPSRAALRCWRRVVAPVAVRYERAWPCAAVRGRARPCEACGNSSQPTRHRAFPVGRAGCAAGALPGSLRCTALRVSSRQAAARSARTTAALPHALRLFALPAATAALRAPPRRHFSTPATHRGPSSETVGAIRGISAGRPPR